MVCLRELEAIERRWKDAGSPRCEHRRTAKERMDFAGAQSGDRGCLDCGLTWWDAQPTPEPRGI